MIAPNSKPAPLKQTAQDLVNRLQQILQRVIYRTQPGELNRAAWWICKNCNRTSGESADKIPHTPEDCYAAAMEEALNVASQPRPSAGQVIFHSLREVAQSHHFDTDGVCTCCNMSDSYTQSYGIMCPSAGQTEAPKLIKSRLIDTLNLLTRPP